MSCPRPTPTLLRRRQPGRRTRGFTMVELLVVIVILAILLALLLPAINGALRSGRNAAVSAEISQLAQALADFKSKFGVYPPSKVVLSETGNYSPAYLNSVLPSTRQAEGRALASRSVSYLRRIWPRMVLNTANGATLNTSQIPGGWYDFNGDNVAPQTDGNGNLLSGQIHILDGAECLVFFLGGMPGLADGNFTVSGFAKNPANPAISPLNALGQNRVPSFFEFRPGRLVDNYPVFGSTPGNGFPEYLDGLAGGTPQPFAYFSSYEGAGYDPDDVNYAEEGDLANGNQIAGSWNSDGTVNSGIGSAFVSANVPGRTSPIASFSPNPYTTGSPILSSGNTVPPEFVNRNTFQIISAGGDNLFGIGGAFNANASAGESLQFNAAAALPSGLSAKIRQMERDNLTNFKNGTLQ